MEITIDPIAPRRDGGEISSIVVHFTARLEDDSVDFKGSIPLTDFGNLIDFKGIEEAIKSEVVKRIMDKEADAE